MSTLRFELYRMAYGGYGWRLKRADETPLAVGDNRYANKADARNSIEAVKRDAPNARIVDESEVQG